MGRKAEYVEKIEMQLRQWSAATEELRARAAEAEHGTRVEVYREIQVISSRHRHIVNGLRQIERADDSTWVRHKQTVEKARAQLRGALDAAVFKLN